MTPRHDAEKLWSALRAINVDIPVDAIAVLSQQDFDAMWEWVKAMKRGEEIKPGFFEKLHEAKAEQAENTVKIVVGDKDPATENARQHAAIYREPD